MKILIHPIHQGAKIIMKFNPNNYSHINKINRIAMKIKRNETITNKEQRLFQSMLIFVESSIVNELGK